MATRERGQLVLKGIGRTRPEGCISDFAFDAWRAGELEPTQIRQFERHLEKCSRCEGRHDVLEAQAEAFLSRYPELVHEDLRSVHPSDKARRAGPAARTRSKLWVAGSGLAALAAAAAFSLVLRPSEPNGSESGTRIKGNARLGFFIKRGAAVTPGVAGQVVFPGDQVRFSITTVQPSHIAILGLDGAGVVSTYYPNRRESVAVDVVREHPLETSIELDATLGQERFFGIFCDEPFSIAPLVEALENEGRLGSLAGCSVDELAVTKRAP